MGETFASSTKTTLQVPVLFSEDWFALVSTPIKIADAMRIPKAKKALDSEYYKLEIKKKAWELKSVRERSCVEQEARDNDKEVHFGTIMPFCHLVSSHCPKGLTRAESYSGVTMFGTKRDTSLSFPNREPQPVISARLSSWMPLHGCPAMMDSPPLR